MGVQSRNIPPSYDRGSAIVSHAQLARGRSTVERATALGVLGLSFLGSVVAMHGSWTPLIDLQPVWGLVASGLLLQGILTWLQWAYSQELVVAILARAVDALLTALGFGPLVLWGIASWFAPMLAERDLLVPIWGSLTTPTLAAWIVIWLVSLLPAWYPESRLVGW